MRLHLTGALIAAFLLAGCSLPDNGNSAAESTMETASHETLIRRVLELLDARQLDEAFALYSEDYVYHGPGGQELRGRNGIRGLWELFLGGFPDLSATIHDTIVQHDKLVLRWSVHGTHTGEFLGIAPTHKSINLPVTEIFVIANGQLVEAWDQYDRLHMFEQLGVNPHAL